MPNFGFKHTEESKRKMMGRIPWNKGKKGSQIPWNKGTKGIMKAWNKGIKNPYSKETIEKIRLAHIIPKIKYICKFCKKEFWDRAKTERKYCSHKCSEMANIKKIKRICKTCKKEFYVPPHYIKTKKIGKFCSNKCVNAFYKGKKCPYLAGKNNPMYGRRGKKHPSWRDGKKTEMGYILIYKPNHPFASRNYVPKHRLVIEKHLGRFLKPEERVHHKGIKYPINSIENKQDNRIKNLKLFANTNKHLIFHKKLKKI